MNQDEVENYEEHQRKSMKLLGRYIMAIGNNDFQEALDLLLEIADYADSIPLEVERKSDADPAKAIGMFAEEWHRYLRETGHPTPTGALMRGLVDTIRGALAEIPKKE
jgi:hypothetical protein